MALTNVLLLQSTQGEVSLSGSPVRASGSTRAVGSLYTVAIHALNFVGRVYIEGTLATSPEAEDWFPIVLPDVDTAYLEWTQPTNQIHGFNFKGSFAWIRARMDRSHLGIDNISEQLLGSQYGYIDKIELNMGTWAETALPTSTGPSFSNVESVRGSNLGTGAKVYNASVGQTNVLLQFKTLAEGPGIILTENEQTITIESTGAGGGGGGSSTFTGLTDTPNQITNKGVLIGNNAGSLVYVTPPTTNGQILTNTASGVAWVTPSSAAPTITVKDEGTLIAEATEINFVGTGVTVTNDGTGKAVVTVGSVTEGSIDAHTEYVQFQYTAGNAGTLNSGDVVMSKTAGVTVTIVDAVNCIVEFTFTSRLYPPSAISMMGQAYATNEFNFANVNPSIATRKVKSGGTAAVPSIMGSFTGPITLQLRMSDTGASAGAGQRAKAIVMFRF